MSVETKSVLSDNGNQKQVIKLDKNFHIYVHGSHKHIRKGYDRRNKKNYYKIYFNEES